MSQEIDNIINYIIETAQQLLEEGRKHVSKSKHGIIWITIVKFEVCDEARIGIYPPEKDVFLSIDCDCGWSDGRLSINDLDDYITKLSFLEFIKIAVERMVHDEA